VCAYSFFLFARLCALVHTVTWSGFCSAEAQTCNNHKKTQDIRTYAHVDGHVQTFIY